MNDPSVAALLPRRHWLAAAVLSVALMACAPLSGPAATATGADPLPSWNAGANKQRIIDFVRAVSTAGSQDFVPLPERIAVFDNDGTLWLEYPLYTQVKFVLDRVRETAPQHPQWKDQEPFKSVIAGDMKAAMASGERGLFEMLLAVQSGMTTDQFQQLVRQWDAVARDPRFKRPYTELTYQPMQELLRYLRGNGFSTYIVSGGTVEFMRAFALQVYGVAPEQVLGSRQKLAYELKPGGPEVTMMPQIDVNNDKAGKPTSIEAYIGKRPIAAFGNSDGDFQMLQWTSTGKGARLSMIVHHDDAVREYAYDRDSPVGKLVEGLDQYKALGWSLISMKNDWNVVFAPVK